MSVTVPVVFCTSKSYFPLTMVAVASIINHINPSTYLEIFLFHTELTETESKVKEKYENDKVSITFLHVGDKVQDLVDSGLFFSPGRHLKIETFYRLLIPDLLPEYDKIIYLDGDLVVKDDISILYAFNISAYLFAGINEKKSKLSPEETELGHRKELYFNSGVLLINAKAFREENCLEQCFDVLKKVPQHLLMYPDQDLLNLLFYDRVLFLPQQWNTMTGVVSNLPARSPFWNHIKSTEDPDFRGSIIHYTKKAHTNPYTYFAADFWETAKRVTLPDGESAYHHYEEKLLEEVLRMQSHKEAMGKRYEEFLSFWMFASESHHLCFFGDAREGKMVLSRFKDTNLKFPFAFLDYSHLYRGLQVEGIPLKTMNAVLQEHPDCYFLLTHASEGGNFYQKLLNKGIPKERIFLTDWNQYL